MAALLLSLLSAINWWMAKVHSLIWPEVGLLLTVFSLLCPEDAEHSRHPKCVQPVSIRLCEGYLKPEDLGVGVGSALESR
jgi:hypothetical protein